MRLRKKEKRKEEENEEEIKQENKIEIKVVIVGDAGTGKSSLALRFIRDEFKPYTESTIGSSFMTKTLTMTSIDGNYNQRTNSSVDTKNSKSILFGLGRSKRDMENVSADTIENESNKNRIVQFNIWDTAGQEKYRSLTNMYYRGTGAALLVYDITNPSSFASLARCVSDLKGALGAYKHTGNGSHAMATLPSQSAASTAASLGIIIGLCGNKSDWKEKRRVPMKDAQKYADNLGAFYFETSARDNVNVHSIFHEIGKRAIVRHKEQEEDLRRQRHEEEKERGEGRLFEPSLNDSGIPADAPLNLEESINVTNNQERASSASCCAIS